MKIVQILYSFDMGGIENFAMDLANYLSYDNIDNSIIFTSKGRDEKWCAQKIEEIKKTNTNIYEAFGSNKLTKFIKLIKLLKTIKPDIIICHHERNTFRLIFANLFIKTKIIQIQHNTHINIKNIHKYFVKYFISKYIGVSLNVLTNLKDSIKVKDNKGIYINNGIVLDKFSNIKRKDKEHIVIGGVGRLHEQKNFIGFVNVITSIIDENRNINIKVLIAGDGEQKEEITDLVKNYKNISLLGNVSNMKDFYETIDIYMTYSKYEGLSLALLEAIATKCVVITTKTSGNSQIIKNDYNGYIIPQKNEQLFKEKLITLIKNKEIREKFIINGEKEIGKYDFSNTYKQYKKVFEEIIT